MSMEVDAAMLEEHDWWVINEMARESLCWRRLDLYLIRLGAMFERGLDYGLPYEGSET